MRSSVSPLLLVAATLVGCPLPQPLPDYPPGAVTPPRIVVDDSVTQIASPGTIVRVPANCPPGHAPSFPLDAQIRDANTLEPIVVRWFVNYDPGPGARQQPVFFETVTSNVPTDPTLRDIQSWTFFPYDYSSDSITTGAGGAAGAFHIVELVVSNGFYVGEAEPLPNRSPAPGFEVQVYRWVFLNVQESTTGCIAGDPGCVLCPP